MSKRKKIFELSGLGFISFIYLLLIWYGLSLQNIDLKETIKLKGIVSNKGIDNHVSTKRKKSKCFFLKLNNLDYKVGVKRWFKSYDDLNNNIKIGDTVTINYFDNYKPFENINIDLVQIEKKGLIIFEKGEYERGQMLIVYVCSILLVINFFLSYKVVKRKR